MYMCFCKRKTAYEVRISDWSSDVCSADLQGDQGREQGEERDGDRRTRRRRQGGDDRRRRCAGIDRALAQYRWAGAGAGGPSDPQPRPDREDRKNRVAGTGWSVSVDCGGTSKLKKNKIYTTIHN